MTSSNNPAPVKNRQSSNGQRFILIKLFSKLKRFVQVKLLKKSVKRSLAARRGECQRCGACCQIVFRCPHLDFDEDNLALCKIYQKRFEQCSYYPITPWDQNDVEVKCGYSFIKSKK